MNKDQVEWLLYAIGAIIGSGICSIIGIESGPGLILAGVFLTGVALKNKGITDAPVRKDGKVTNGADGASKLLVIFLLLASGLMLGWYTWHEDRDEPSNMLAPCAVLHGSASADPRFSRVLWLAGDAAGTLSPEAQAAGDR